MPRLLTCLLLACLLHLPALAQPPLSWQDAAALPDAGDLVQPAAPPLLGQALAGQWRGALHYRDYSNDKGVTLPTTATIEGAGTALRLAFTYDDGPGKTVRSTEAWVFDGTTLNMGKSGAPMAVTDYRGNARGDVLLVALGSGVENGVAVEVRSVVLRRGGALTISRSSRLPQGDWLLRHVYRLSPAQ